MAKTTRTTSSFTTKSSPKSERFQASGFQRHVLGVLALLLMLGGLSLLIGTEDETIYALGSMGWRIGLALGVLWLALPQVLVLGASLQPRTAIACVLGGIMIVARPKLFPIVLLIVGAMAILESVGGLLRPLSKPRNRR